MAWAEDDVKAIGIVGGLAWPSSAICYRTINELVARRLGGLRMQATALARSKIPAPARTEAIAAARAGQAAAPTAVRAPAAPAASPARTPGPASPRW